MQDDPPRAIPSRPARGAVLLDSLIDKELAATLKAHGFASRAIHQHWADIVGSALSARSEAVALKWPPRPQGEVSAAAVTGATLIVKVESAFALEMQHAAPQVIERVNGFFGWRCVERLQLKQGRLNRDAPPSRPRKRPLRVEESKQLDALMQDVTSEPLKDALQRLGVAILTRGR